MIRLGAATLVFLKQRGDQQACEALVKAHAIFMPAHSVGMTPAFYYSQGQFLMVATPIK